ncbi:major tail tube protein [Xanthomonas phage Langgrundblatt1]|uniref:Major tail tube protein n=1 Tax=Xanthomonas phage Langgrundblatt1 TaxID=2939128 RepID=A0A9E7E0U4_9CAUD|nr:major tail tube protein [Xanthomonas phage Langgrundblatt1]URA06802.1 major tail tube protein [Xanthomonas phage Langgrundblatt1]
MVCEVVKIDSNITGLSIAEEVCLKQLPVLAVDGFDPVWYGQEPNSYSDFGGELTTVARAPIDPSRQNKKGTPTDLDASGGYNTDVTQNNLTRILQGYFFADARRKPSTVSLAMGTPNTALTSVTASSKTYGAAAGLLPFNKAGYLVKASGFANAANNGIKTVVSATATTVVVSETVVDEASPGPNARLEVVGFKGTAADLSFAVVSGIPSLVSAAALDFTTLGLTLGEWIWIGGDAAGSFFADNRGFARIASITATALTFDDTEFTPTNAVGTGVTLQLFFGTVIRNEKTPALIKRRSYQIERTLGEGPEAENPGDQQAEYLEGAVCNELTLNIPQADKLNVDLTFVACDNTQRSGAAGDKIKSATLGTLVPALGEDAFNTSSDIRRIKMAILDPSTSRPTPLFGYVTEANLTVANGITPNKAVGTMGAIDTSAGNFVVSGSITAYFTSVAATRAIRNNADVGLSEIVASKNAGMIWDIPLLGLGGGRLNVEKDAPITVPLEPQAAECANGYTLMYVNFAYLPNAAMPG